MTTEVTALSEEFEADVTLIRPLHGVFPKVITQVTALAEDRLTACVLATEVQLGALRFAVPDLNCFVPFIWDTFEVLDFTGLTFCHGKLRSDFIFDINALLRLFLGGGGLLRILTGPILTRTAVLRSH